MTTDRWWRRAGYGLADADRSHAMQRRRIAWGARNDGDRVAFQPDEKAAQDRLVADVAIAIRADHQDRAAQPLSDHAHQVPGAKATSWRSRI